ncbi:hypothetical protein P3T37_000798 [Kitasatospora sp. MAA4]|uniref:hypothetical protein n=1 Tax=Kitasatospora sp. MAA4 TaxID=3035093 RepID=UPI0024734D91|nr:hypothetical protein [Kitasatospora sp. MAA4]MDH6131429.1 hypothetical protein [Kitasatospora sp. MAA4]
MISTFKRRSATAAIVAALSIGGLALSTTSAFASGIGGDVYTSNCHGYVVGDSQNNHYAYGYVTGSGCEVRLWQRNVNTGGETVNGWSYSSTSEYYHNDGVHQLAVEVYDNSTGEDSGPWNWVG